MKRGDDDERDATDDHEKRDRRAKGKELAVLEQRSRSPLAVLKVLLGESADAVSGVIEDVNLLAEVDAAAELVNPLVDFCVLIRNGAGIK